jgi:imidazolonepropionase-like amidohydrolase
MEHGVYDVHLILHKVGSEEYRITREGSERKLTAVVTTNDRGMVRTSTTTLDFAANGTPIRLRQQSTPAGAPTAAPAAPPSDIDLGGSRVIASEAGISRTFAKPPMAFPAVANMPASVQMMLVRYWETHGRPARLPILRAGEGALPVEIRLVGHEAFSLHGHTLRLARYTIANLIFGREVLWMNDSHRVAAVMTFAGGLPQEFVLDQYAAAFDGLVQSGVTQEMLDLAELTHSVRPEAAGTYAIVGARMVNTQPDAATPTIENAAVLIRDGRIAAAGPAGSVAIPPGTRIVHAEGKTLLPGLYEMHSHYSGVEFGPALLASGVTTARDCGGEFTFLTHTRSAIEHGQLGPRLLLAGLIDSGGPLGFGAFLVDTPDKARQIVDLYADQHFDQIKVYTQLQPQILQTIAAEAHARGLTVTGHVPAAVDTFAGIAFGMDQINHLQFITRAMQPPGTKTPFTAADLDSPRAHELIALLARKHIVVDPTLGWGEMAGHPKTIPTVSFEPGVEAAPFPLAWRFETIGTAVADGHAEHDQIAFNDRMALNRRVVGELFHAGVPIVPGSDTNLIGYGLDRELELYVEAGMTPLEAIRSATLVSAQAMHREADSGSIEPGKRADLVLIDGNPLDNISDLRRVAKVVTAGRLYDSHALGRVVGFNR